MGCVLRTSSYQHMDTKVKSPTGCFSAQISCHFCLLIKPQICYLLKIPATLGAKSHFCYLGPQKLWNDFHVIHKAFVQNSTAKKKIAELDQLLVFWGVHIHWCHIHWCHIHWCHVTVLLVHRSIYQSISKAMAKNVFYKLVSPCWCNKIEKYN